MFHFTENHRFTVARDFSLSPFDHKVLQLMYQPMIGAMASSLYHTLYHQMPGDRTGYAEPEQQRKIFLSLDLEPSEKGRKMLVSLSSKLEATGLLSAYRLYLPENDEYMYVYKLHPPLSPAEFFNNPHLLLLLQDKVGKHMVLSLKEQFYQQPAEELLDASIVHEDISVPFYDIFRLGSFEVDAELEEAMQQMAASAASEFNKRPIFEDSGWTYDDIIGRFPKNSLNRTHVENLCRNHEQLARINFVAHKYELTLAEVCRLLDEDGVFAGDGTVRMDVLQHKASSLFHQTRKREESRERFLHKIGEGEPAQEQQQDEKQVSADYYLDVPEIFEGKCNVHQYNLILRNESYMQLLRRIFPGSVPDPVLKVFERIDLNYKLNEEVINVLIHYLHTHNLSWNARFVEAIAADMLGKQVDTFEKAVEYIRAQRSRQEKRKSDVAAVYAGNSGNFRNKKPQLTAVTSEKKRTLSDEDYQRILQKARELEGQ